MNLVQTNPTTLVSKTSGLSAIIAGSMIGAVGLIGIPTAIIIKADPFVIVFAGIFLAIGIIVIATAKKRTVTLMNPGTSTIVATRLIGGKTTTTVFNNTQVAGVQVESRIDQSGSTGTPTNPRRTTTLKLYLTDWTALTLAQEMKNQNSFTLNGIGAHLTLPLDTEGQQIASLFGVQFLSKDNSFGDNPVQVIADTTRLIREAMDAQKTGAPYEQPADQAERSPLTPQSNPFDSGTTASYAPASVQPSVTLATPPTPQVQPTQSYQPRPQIQPQPRPTDTRQP